MQRPPLPHRKYSWYSLLLQLSRPHGHSAGGSFILKKNSNDTTGSGDIIFDLIWIQRSLNIYVKLKLEYQHEVIRTIYQRITRKIYTSLFFFSVALRPNAGHGLLILEASDHTQRRITVGRTPLDEWTARRRDLYLTTHNTHNRQTSMPPVGFKPTISASERPQTYALDRAAGTCHFITIIIKYS